MEVEEIEAVLERIWDLHDKLSDAIHVITRSHFLNSLPTTNKKPPPPPPPTKGFVFAKELDDDSAAAVHEAKSLNAIRSALENLEDQLDFFHTVQTQQRAERDSAIARLEQSRIILALRLAEHQGKKYKVIEEALAFVGDVQDASRFVFPENLYTRPGSLSAQNPLRQGGGNNRSNPVLRVLFSSFELVKKSLAADHVGSVLGNAAVFAVSVIALLHLHQVTYKGHSYELEAANYDGRNTHNAHRLDGSPSDNSLNQLDVMLARG